jgi:predicted dehydrogenase
VHLHHDHTVLAAAAGKHVLVEKPMALTPRQCRQMMTSCRRGKVKLQVGYMRRFHPYHAKIKEIIGRGTLGKIVEARIQTHLWYPPMEGAWRQDPRHGGGGAFIDLGSHCLELLEFFLGEIVWVQGFTDNVAFHYGVEDLSMAIVKFRCGATGIVDASFAIPYRENVLEIYGTKGTLSAKRTAGPFADPELVLLDDNGATTVAIAETKDQYQAEFEHFARAILEGAEPAIDGKAGLRNLKQILAVYESARKKRPVRIAT